jgi:Protein of unknown function (DUF3060)
MRVAHYLVFGAVTAFGLSGFCLAEPNPVLIGATNAVIKEEGNNRNFTIAGNHDEIHIRGDCNSIQITGAQNRIYLDKVGRISITGAQNRVSYKSGLTAAEPVIVGIVVQNRVVKIKADEASDETSTNGKSEPAAPTPTRPVAKGLTGEVAFTGDGRVLKQAVNAKKVQVVGNNNKLDLPGAADELAITGNNNSVKIDQIKKVSFIGTNNKVSYKSTPDGSKAEVSQLGNNNDASTGQ